MKKTLFFVSLLLLSTASFPAGLPVTDIPRVIMEFIIDKVLMEKDETKQRQKLAQMIKILMEVKKIRARHTELLSMNEDLEKELRLVREVKDLKLHEVVRIAEKVLSVTNELYAHDLPYMEEYALLKGAISGIESASVAYDFMLGGTTLYADLKGDTPASYSGNAALLQGQAIKRYGVEVDAAKRSIHTALAYYQLSNDLTEQAVDLQQQVGTSGVWNLLGLGDIFSDATEGLDFVSDLVDVDIAGLTDHIKDWARDIKDDLKMGDSPILSEDNEDKSEKIREKVEEKMGEFDFEGLLGSLLGGISDLLPLPEYAVEFEKEGMRMTTGERIEVQGIALDNMEQAVEIKLEADKLLLEATQKSDHLQKVDATYENALFRKSLTLVPLYE